MLSFLLDLAGFLGGGVVFCLSWGRVGFLYRYSVAPSATFVVAPSATLVVPLGYTRRSLNYTRRSLGYNRRSRGFRREPSVVFLFEFAVLRRWVPA